MATPSFSESGMSGPVENSDECYRKSEVQYGGQKPEVHVTQFLYKLSMEVKRNFDNIMSM